MQRLDYQRLQPEPEDDRWFVLLLLVGIALLPFAFGLILGLVWLLGMGRF